MIGTRELTSIALTISNAWTHFVCQFLFANFVDFLGVNVLIQRKWSCIRVSSGGKHLLQFSIDRGHGGSHDQITSVTFFQFSILLSFTISLNTDIWKICLKIMKKLYAQACFRWFTKDGAEISLH